MFALARGAHYHRRAANWAAWRGDDRIRPIGLIRRIRPIFLLLTALRQSRRSQLLSVTTASHEAALERRDLLVEQVVRLVDKADHSVGDDCRISSIEPARVFFPVIRRIRPIGLIGRISSHADRANGSSLRVIFAPLAVTVLAQKIFVVEQQLIEACSCDVHQAQFRLAGGRRGSAAFGDVLPAAAPGLDHLIVGARTLTDKAIAKRNRRIVDDCGYLEAAEFTITAARS